ncbi:MAG: GerW family sporulation protein [Oscillospiraceae bacterium]
MDKQPISDLMDTVMTKIHEMVDVSTVIGEPINTADGITIIPVSKVSFGFAAGGSDFTGKNQQASQKNPFGGGSGAGVKINPVAFVVIKDGAVRIMNIEPPASNTVDRIIDNAPEIIDKISALIKKEDEEKK